MSTSEYGFHSNLKVVEGSVSKERVGCSCYPRPLRTNPTPEPCEDFYFEKNRPNVPPADVPPQPNPLQIESNRLERIRRELIPLTERLEGRLSRLEDQIPNAQPRESVLDEMMRSFTTLLMSIHYCRLECTAELCLDSNFCNVIIIDQHVGAVQSINPSASPEVGDNTSSGLCGTTSQV